MNTKQLGPAIKLIALALPLFLISSTPSFGQSSFFDDFSGGPLEDASRTPVVWNITGESAGTTAIVGGDVVMTPTVDEFLGVITDGIEHTDFTIRIQARFLGSPDRSGFFGIGGRRDDFTSNSFFYWGGMRADGTLAAGRVSNGNVFIRRDDIPTNTDPVNGDFNLEFTVVGNDISLTGWQEGDNKPAIPQVSYSGIPFIITSGEIVEFFYNPSNELTPVVIRSFEFIRIPEPSTAALAALISICVVARRRGWK